MTSPLHIVRTFLFSGALLLLGPVAFSAEPALYERLGGEKAIARIVDETINKTATDPATKRTFDKVNLAKLKPIIVEHFCSLTQGPCKYSGDTMAVSHKGLDITESEFYGMVQNLRDVLNNMGVAESEKNDLLKLLAPMKRDIVAR